MAPTPLTQQVAARILDHIRASAMPRGARLVERTLAEQLRVSRSPVREALRLLAAEGLVEAAERGGYAVLRTGAELHGPTTAEDVADDDRVYFRLAEDRLNGVLPDRVTESALARGYRLTERQLLRVLHRIEAEGWIERRPGYGWEFRPMLTSLDAYRDSYRFRLAIEPVAILEPGFVLDRAAVQEARERQRRLVDGEIWTVSKATLFDLNSHFHQTVLACSRNVFFTEGLKRVDTVRRLMEYRQTLARDRALVRCREHVAIADLLLAGDRRAAAAALRRHLSTVGPEKLIAGGNAPS
jgi:DNA-binding GntR family transcriptional regulator